MNEIIEKEDIKIENLIYEIRGVQVMLDSDLAQLYQCKNGTKEINQAVKNNPKKFPERFSWTLTDDESKILLVKIFDQKKETRGGRFKNPRVFTEQGISMLTTILKTKVAVEISIRIMDAFVAMRHYLVDNKDVYMSLNNINNRLTNQELKLKEHDDKFDLLFSNFKEKNNYIFFDGQMYDAYSLMMNILDKAKKEIIIVDNYIDRNILNILSKTNKQVILVTNSYNNDDYNKYKSQYHNITLKINNKIHDRFIILDKTILYNFGASFKDLGNKCFSINKIDDVEIIMHC